MYISFPTSFTQQPDSSQLSSFYSVLVCFLSRSPLKCVILVYIILLFTTDTSNYLGWVGKQLYHSTCQYSVHFDSVVCLKHTFKHINQDTNLFLAVAECFHHSWWLAQSQGHSHILSCGHEELIFLHSCEIKSGVAWEQAQLVARTQSFCTGFCLAGLSAQCILNCVQTNSVHQAPLFSANTRTWDQG